MRRFRWLMLEIGIAALLLVAMQISMWTIAGAPVLAQIEAPATGDSVIPVPPANGLGQPVLSPSTTRPTDDPEPTESESESAAAVTEDSEDTTGADAVAGADEITATNVLTAAGAPTYYVVLPGDTLLVIATDFGATVELVMEANGMADADIIHAGQLLLIPGANGELPDPALLPVVVADGEFTQTVIAPRGTITERMTSLAQQTTVNSPYHNKTWLTYYGRPNVDVMGILGEYSIDDLVPLLRAEAEAYDRANGDSLGVAPAFHLVYGMATKAAGDDDSHLAYMAEDNVKAYIEAAEEEGWGVILDVQIGALSPAEAISPALAYLEYPNVHLAIDPEFAMVHPGQNWPGNPIGFVTAQQVNEVQAVIDAYLDREQLPAPRILLVHQFQSSMIEEPEKMDKHSYGRVALTVSVDGWGPPWGKISKYNSMITPDSPFSAFKLFYRWDEPLLLPDEVFGTFPYRGSDFFMDVTPNFIIFQ